MEAQVDWREGVSTAEQARLQDRVAAAIKGVDCNEHQANETAKLFIATQLKKAASRESFLERVEKKLAKATAVVTAPSPEKKTEAADEAAVAMRAFFKSPPIVFSDGALDAAEQMLAKATGQLRDLTASEKGAPLQLLPALCSLGSKSVLLGISNTTQLVMILHGSKPTAQVADVALGGENAQLLAMLSVLRVLSRSANHALKLPPSVGPLLWSTRRFFDKFDGSTATLSPNSSLSKAMIVFVPTATTDVISDFESLASDLPSDHSSAILDPGEEHKKWGPTFLKFMKLLNCFAPARPPPPLCFGDFRTFQKFQKIMKFQNVQKHFRQIREK